MPVLICWQANCSGCKSCAPNEIRTRVTGLKSPCPRPLDDGGARNVEDTCRMTRDPAATRTRNLQLRRLLLYPLSYGASGTCEITFTKQLYNIRLSSVFRKTGNLHPLSLKPRARNRTVDCGLTIHDPIQRSEFRTQNSEFARRYPDRIVSMALFAELNAQMMEPPFAPALRSPIRKSPGTEV